MRLRTSAILPTALCCLACGTGSSLAAEQPSVAFLRDAHRASVEAVRSLHTRIELHTMDHVEGVGDQFTRGEYWRDGALTRQRCEEPTGPIDIIRRGDRKWVFREREGRRTVTVVGSTRPVNVIDGWMLSFFTLPAGSQSLDELLSDPLSRIHVTSARTGGKVIHRVDVARHAAMWVFDLDPTVNYLIRKLTWVNGPSRFEGEVTSFEEHGRSVFFPKTVFRRCYNRQTLLQEATVTFSDTKVNQPINSSVFDLRLTSGTLVADNMNHTFYPVDSSGRPVGPQQPLPPAVLDPGGAQRATVAAPTTRSHWYLIAGMATLLLVGLVLIRRRQAARPTGE